MAGETMNPAECGLKEQKQKRYVDINPAIEFLEGYDNSWGREFADGVRTALHFIKKLPAADVREVKHGKWIDTEAYTNHCGHIYECSNCHKEVADDFIVKYTYCLHCGAKMDGKEDGK